MFNGELQKEMAKFNLFFPLDSPSAEISTIGGELAASDSGPRRFMYGNARDLVLGLTAVTPAGDIIHPGGKTMKNVAGIDLCKLLVGSWGTLGIITEAVLRLLPLPESNATLHLAFPTVKNAFRLVNQILNSKLTPSAMQLTLGPADEIVLMILIEGYSEVVERHLSEIRAMARAEGAGFLDHANLYQTSSSQFASSMKGKASVPITKLPDMITAAREIGARSKAVVSVRADCGNGRCDLYVQTIDTGALEIISALKQAAAGLGGFFILETAPFEIRKQISIWPRPQGYGLMVKLKAELDPNNILNPGKLIGG